jgi:hypothetical protein
MINRAAAGYGGQVGNILPGAVGGNISRTGRSAREAHLLLTRPPFTSAYCKPRGGYMHSVGNSGIC